MKVKKSLFARGEYLVSSKGKRLTKTYSWIELDVRGKLAIIEYKRKGGYNTYYRVFDAATETEITNMPIRNHYEHEDGYTVIWTGSVYEIWNENGRVRNDLTSFSGSGNPKYYIGTLDGHSHFLDKDLNIISNGYDRISSFDKFGYTVCKAGERHFYVLDSNLSPVLDVRDVDAVEAISKEYFVFRSGGLEGVVHKSGKVIIPNIYHKVHWKKGKYFKVSFEKHYGLIDTTGKIVFEPIYDEIIETPEKFVVKDFARMEEFKDKSVPKE